MAGLASAIYGWEMDTDRAIPFRPEDWGQVFQMLAQALEDRRAIVILDEIPFAMQSDRGLDTHIQAAWDHLFKDGQAIFFLSGADAGMMSELIGYHAPLYGRVTSQLPLDPVNFSGVRSFIPRYDVQKRMAVYSMLGGIPAYLERWRDTESIKRNVSRLFLKRTGWFRSEPLVLISDLTERETTNYEAILKAIAGGRHGRDEIAAGAALPSSSLSHYLPRLEALHLVQRRLPATVPLDERNTSRKSRYYLNDPFLKFYYRFIDPNLHLIEGGLPKRLWTMIEENLRAFVALEFENVCREWAVHMSRRNALPFAPEAIGTHWSGEVQVDLVAINWREKQVLLGECKWGGRAVPRKVVVELVEGKTPKLLRELPEQGEGWRVHHVLFARIGFTSAAEREAEQVGAMLRALEQVEAELAV